MNAVCRAVPSDTRTRRCAQVKNMTSAQKAMRRAFVQETCGPQLLPGKAQAGVARSKHTTELLVRTQRLAGGRLILCTGSWHAFKPASLDRGTETEAIDPVSKVLDAFHSTGSTSEDAWAPHAWFSASRRPLALWRAAAPRHAGAPAGGARPRTAERA